MAPPPLLLMLLASQLFGKIGLIYRIWNSVVPMNKRSRNPRGIVSKKNTPLSLRGGIVLQCRLLWSFLPFSPFISRHLSGRVERHVHSLLLSISNVKDVPWVVTGCVYILSEFSHPEWWPGPVALCPLWHWLCLRWHNGDGAMAGKRKALCTVWRASCFVHIQGLRRCDPLLETRGHFILTWTKGVNYWKARRS